jgi:hypothetical protein
MSGHEHYYFVCCVERTATHISFEHIVRTEAECGKNLWFLFCGLGRHPFDRHNGIGVQVHVKGSPCFIASKFIRLSASQYIVPCPSKSKTMITAVSSDNECCELQPTDSSYLMSALLSPRIATLPNIHSLEIKNLAPISCTLWVEPYFP